MPKIYKLQYKEAGEKKWHTADKKFRKMKTAKKAQTEAWDTGLSARIRVAKKKEKVK